MRMKRDLSSSFRSRVRWVRFIGTVTTFDLSCGAADWARTGVDIVEKTRRQARAKIEHRLDGP